MPSRPIIPSEGVDPRGLRPDPVGGRALAAALQLGDPVQDGAIQRRQLLGHRVRLHPAQDDSGQGLRGIAQPSGVPPLMGSLEEVGAGGAGRAWAGSRTRWVTHALGHAWAGLRACWAPPTRGTSDPGRCSTRERIPDERLVVRSPDCSSCLSGRRTTRDLCEKCSLVERPDRPPATASARLSRTESSALSRASGSRWGRRTGTPPAGAGHPARGRPPLHAGSRCRRSFRRAGG